MFPEDRPRRLRQNAAMRRMVRETSLSVDDLIYPLFVKEGKSIREAISAMPGQIRYSPDQLAGEAKKIASMGIPAVLLFGIPRTKDKFGTQAHKSDGVVQ
ncbi:MAG TPA: porphobilinogen synthase, partial [Deltaproteobacteria bacterium]|nr:porphobilinogen synthase [Deltaproteobacteria bacterium]